MAGNVFKTIEPNNELEKLLLELTAERGPFLVQKNRAYGNAASSSAAIMKYYFPDGIKPEQYEDAIFINRIVDKLMRIATNNDPFGEHPELDIAGYADLRNAQKTLAKAKQAAELLDSKSQEGVQQRGMFGGLYKSGATDDYPPFPTAADTFTGKPIDSDPFIGMRHLVKLCRCSARPFHYAHRRDGTLRTQPHDSLDEALGCEECNGGDRRK